MKKMCKQCLNLFKCVLVEMSLTIVLKSIILLSCHIQKVSSQRTDKERKGGEQ